MFNVFSTLNRSFMSAPLHFQPTGAISIFHFIIYYINTSEIPGELSRVNMISQVLLSQVLRLPLLQLHRKVKKQTNKVKVKDDHRS